MSFEDAIKGLTELARSDGVLDRSQVDRIVDAYLRDFAGNRALERVRIAEAFEQTVGRRAVKSDDIYRMVKRL